MVLAVVNSDAWVTKNFVANIFLVGYNINGQLSKMANQLFVIWESLHHVYMKQSQ